MKLLVVGASGLVGSHLRRTLTSLGEVRGTFRSSPHPGLDALDVREATAVSQCVDGARPDVVICAAADPNVDGCERDPAGTRLVNVDGFRNVARAAQQVGAKIVYFSSDYVFDGENGPYSEDDPVAPINEYGRQKVEAEAITRESSAHLICRISGVFGWEPRRKNFVCQVVDRLRAGQPVTAATDQVLCPTYAAEIAAAVRDLLANGATGTVHVVGPEALARADFARRIAQAFGLDASNVSGVPTSDMQLAARRPRYSALRDDRLRNLLGKGLAPLEDALRRMRETETVESAN